MQPPKVSGLNHITLAVSDLDVSVAFYRDFLGLRLRMKSDSDAYLEAGTLWLCLSVDNDARLRPHPDYTHISLNVSDDEFEKLSVRIRDIATLWKENRSEGASLYFLDPDGHKLELHVGSLQSRLDYYKANPTPNRKIFD